MTVISGDAEPRSDSLGGPCEGPASEGFGDGPRTVGVSGLSGPAEINGPRPAVAAPTTRPMTTRPATSATSGRRRLVDRRSPRRRGRSGAAAVADASQVAIAVVNGTAATIPRLPTSVRTIST